MPGNEIKGGWIFGWPDREGAASGEYLQHVHGAPLRLVVPGWAGNWWVK
jgi:molybdopterin-dependent oxidoreductase-like protein protein